MIFTPLMVYLDKHYCFSRQDGHLFSLGLLDEVNLVSAAATLINVLEMVPKESNFGVQESLPHLLLMKNRFIFRFTSAD